MDRSLQVCSGDCSGGRRPLGPGAIQADHVPEDLPRPWEPTDYLNFTVLTLISAPIISAIRHPRRIYDIRMVHKALMVWLASQALAVLYRDGGLFSMYDTENKTAWSGMARRAMFLHFGPEFAGLCRSIFYFFFMHQSDTPGVVKNLNIF